MTDNEIIKALECCVTNKCDECAIYKECHSENGKGRVEVVIDLINRQKAEIEGLNIEFQSMRSAANSYKTHYETAKSDAIKEFAHFVIDRSRNGVIYTSDIPDLVKEMNEV